LIWSVKSSFLPGFHERLVVLPNLPPPGFAPTSQTKSTPEFAPNVGKSILPRSSAINLDHVLFTAPYWSSPLNVCTSLAMKMHATLVTKEGRLENHRK
jgi:hypothetical protein